MYRHEKTFLWDFIILGVNIIFGVYNIVNFNLAFLIIWFVLAGIRFVLLVSHQIKWRQIYRLEAEQVNKMKKRGDKEDD